jgi:NAD(P)-dependent dehydrogenase (short-subunit alcohol dehydrogenase family)
VEVLVSKVAVVLGVGPGLGMSVAHRFGAEGFAVAVVSRSPARHDGYVAALAGRGVDAAAFAADVMDPDALGAVLDAVRARFGAIDVVYYGPGAIDPDYRPMDVRETTAADVRKAMEVVYPAVATVAAVLPGMLERGDGGLLFAGGLSGAIPIPALGPHVPASAALRQYVLALHASLAPLGVYAGAVTIGGLVERGDIHAMVTASGMDLPAGTLDPDAIAAEAWDLYAKRDRPEATFNAMR